MRRATTRAGKPNWPITACRNDAFFQFDAGAFALGEQKSHDQARESAARPDVDPVLRGGLDAPQLRAVQYMALPDIA